MADPINSGDTWAVIRGKFNSLIADVAAAVASVAGKLTASSNLSDLPNKAAARTALELGTMAQQNAGTVAISGGTISGLSAPLPIASGGTGGNTPEAAQTALGGTALGRSLFTAANPGAALAALGGQPLDAGLTSIAGLTTAADRMIYTTAPDTYAVATLTAAGRAILADADAAAQRATLGAQAADAKLTSLSGLTLAAGDILYATGADTLVKLAKGTAGQVLQMNSGATAPEWSSSLGTTVGLLTTTGATTVGPWSLPAGVKRFTVTSNKSSLGGAAGSAPMLIQLSVAGSFVTSGYTSRSTSGSGNISNTTGMVVSLNDPSNYWDGAMDFWLHNPATNLWLCRHTGTVADSGQDNVSGSGSIALAGAVDGVRIISTGGRTFDVASFNVFY